MTITYQHDGCKIYYRTRSMWGGGDIRRGIEIPKPLGIVAHHTVVVAPDYDRDGMTIGDSDDMDRFLLYLQNEARPDLGPEVPYSFVLFEDVDPLACWVYEGRGFYRSGAHTQGGRNYDRYGCALEGNSSDDHPSDGVIGGYRWLRDFTTKVARTTGHRDWHATACPGNGLYGRLAEIDNPAWTREEDMMGHRYEVQHDPNANKTWALYGPVDKPFVDVYGSYVPAGESIPNGWYPLRDAIQAGRMVQVG